MKRAVLVFVVAFLMGLVFSPRPLDAYTPPLPAVIPERAALEREIVVFVQVPLTVAPNVVAAVRAWERATKGWRRWRLGHAAEAHLWIIEVEPGRGHCPSWAAGCAGDVGGLARDGDDAWGRAWLVRGQYESGAKVITMHEIGHGLGLDHVDGTIMQAAISIDMYFAPWVCPDGESLARLQWRLGIALDAGACQ